MTDNMEMYFVQFILFIGYFLFKESGLFQGHGEMYDILTLWGHIISFFLSCNCCFGCLILVVDE